MVLAGGRRFDDTVLKVQARKSVNYSQLGAAGCLILVRLRWWVLWVGSMACNSLGGWAAVVGPGPEINTASKTRTLNNSTSRPQCHSIIHSLFCTYFPVPLSLSSRSLPPPPLPPPFVFTHFPLILTHGRNLCTHDGGSSEPPDLGGEPSWMDVR